MSKFVKNTIIGLSILAILWLVMKQRRTSENIILLNDEFYKNQVAEHDAVKEPTIEKGETQRLVLNYNIIPKNAEAFVKNEAKLPYSQINFNVLQSELVGLITFPGHFLFTYPIFTERYLLEIQWLKIVKPLFEKDKEVLKKIPDRNVNIFRPFHTARMLYFWQNFKQNFEECKGQCKDFKFKMAPFTFSDSDLFLDLECKFSTDFVFNTQSINENILTYDKLKLNGPIHKLTLMSDENTYQIQCNSKTSHQQVINVQNLQKSFLLVTYLESSHQILEFELDIFANKNGLLRSPQWHEQFKVKDWRVLQLAIDSHRNLTPQP